MIEHPSGLGAEPIRPAGTRVIALAVGVLLYAAFWGLSQTDPGLDITFHTRFSNSSKGELYFWLGSAFLLFPSACLLGYAASPWIAPGLERLWRWLEGLDHRKSAVLLALFGALAVCLFRGFHDWVLLDFPLTDDEYGIQFGGQLLASGQLKAPTRGLVPFISSLALYVNDGWMSSFDWPGAQAVWALALWTGAGASWTFALFAALPLVVVPLWSARRFGRPWGAVAFALVLFSPMAFGLSMTVHAHVLSRGLLALALWQLWEADQRRDIRRWIVVGLAFGVAMLCRPFEAIFVALPFVIDLAIRAARRRPEAGRALLGLVAGGVAPLVLFGAYNYALSGDPLLHPRFIPGGWGDHELAALDKLWSMELLWNRFGANTSYNLFMLCIWFLGPLGVGLVIAGVMLDRFTRVLGLSVLSTLFLALFHDDHGIHVVGPIHYSECAVPLTYISVAGLAALSDRLGRMGVDLRVPACSLVAALVIGLGSFNLWNALALRNHAEIQGDIYGFLDDAELHHAIVLTDQFAQTWNRIPQYRKLGSWVFEWRPPRPDFSDDVLIFHDVRGARRAARRLFPNRARYRLSSHESEPFLRLTELP